LPHVWGVQYMLCVGLAVAGVVRFVVWDGVRGLACAGRPAGAVCRRDGGRHVAGRGAGLEAGRGCRSAAICRAGRGAQCRVRLAGSWRCL